MSNLTQVAALSLAFARVNRATLHPDGVRPESDSDHTVMLALTALHVATMHPELNLDGATLALLALVHDLPEVYAGDTDTTGGLTATQEADKAAREAEARGRLTGELGDDHLIISALDAYDRQGYHGKFLRYLDKILPKLTHTLNRNAAIRRTGHDADWLAARHKEQGDKLRAKYPEFADVLGPLFDQACAESEAALRGPALGAS